jgi:hypothetical protein
MIRRWRNCGRDAEATEDHYRRNAVVRPYPLMIYCGDYKCAHSIVIDAEQWGDDVRLSEPRVVCQACGHRGANIRPLFEDRRRTG